MKLTNEQIAELLRLEEKATKHEWRAARINGVAYLESKTESGATWGFRSSVFEDKYSWHQLYNDTLAIAKLRNASRPLLEEVLELRAEVAELRKGKT